MRATLLVAVGAALLPGCSVTPDRQLYASGDTASCSRIADVSLRDECLAFAAGEDLAACSAVASEVWRDECAFMVVERGVRTKAEVRRDCERAGQFEEWCVHHAMANELDRLAGSHPVGSEAALARALAEVGAAWFPEAPSADLTYDAHVVVAHVIALGVDGGTFDPRDCGGASDQTCAWAYWISVLPTLDDAAVRSFCAGHLSARRAAAVGLRGWTEGAESVVRDTWAETCSSLWTQRVMSFAPPFHRPRYLGLPTRVSSAS